MGRGSGGSGGRARSVARPRDEGSFEMSTIERCDRSGLGGADGEDVVRVRMLAALPGRAGMSRSMSLRGVDRERGLLGSPTRMLGRLGSAI